MDIQKPWMNIWIYGLYGYSETLEAYLDIGVEWIFRNLWKDIWIQGLHGYSETHFKIQLEFVLPNIF